MGKTILVLALLLVAGAGCTSDNFIGTCKTSTAALAIKQTAVPFIGCDKAVANIITVRALESCVDGWHQDILDGNEPAGYFVICAINNAALLKSESIRFAPVIESKIGLTMKLKNSQHKQLFEATPEQVENAYAMFKNSCRGYYNMVDAWCLGGGK
jgi:hypothetical protein